MNLKDERGFTLIELLAVITIMGVLMMIAIPTVTIIIQNVRKGTYINNAKTFKNEVQKEVINQTWPIDDPDKTYYIHINNVADDRKPTPSPWADWKDAYVAVTVGGKGEFDFYWLSVDDAGWKVELELADELVRGDVFKSNTKRVNYREAIGETSKIAVLDANGVWREFEPHLELSRTDADKCYQFEDTSDTTITIIRYDRECGKDVTVPAKIGGKTVNKIHSYAFNNMNLTSIYIPDTITTIGSNAFASNKLTQLYIPSSVTSIESQAFANNKLTNLTLEEGLKTMGVSCFQNNRLTVALVPNSVTSLGACSYCDNPIPNPSFLYAQSGDTVDYSRVRGYIGNLSEFAGNRFVIPSEVNGIQLKEIMNGAFTRMSLYDWTVVIPESVTKIGGSAFAYSNVAHVNFPSGLTSIGDNAFYYNRLREVNIPNSVTYIGGAAFTNNQVSDPNTMWIYYRSSSGIDYSRLIGYAGANRRNVVIPDKKNGVNLKTIDGGALRYQSLTGSITIPDSVTTIGGTPLALNNLTDVVNGSDDTEVAPFLYSRKPGGGYDKTSILSYAALYTNNVVVPSHVKRLESSSFHYSYIKGITLPEGLEHIGSSAFTVCSLKGTVTIPSTVTYIGGNAFKKEISWGSFNSELTKIVNKTGRSFDWKSITGGPATANFETGTVKSWYGDIEITRS